MNLPETRLQAQVRTGFESLPPSPPRYPEVLPNTPDEIFTRQELDIIAVESLFNRLTTQDNLPDEEAQMINVELIAAIEQVQKGLDNLI